MKKNKKLKLFLMAGLLIVFPIINCGVAFAETFTTKTVESVKKNEQDTTEHSAESDSAIDKDLPVVEIPEAAESTDEIVPQATDVPFSASLGEMNNGEVKLREADDTTEKANVKWELLKNDGYIFSLRLDGYVPSTTPSTRQIEVKIPQGVIVTLADLQRIVQENTNVTACDVVDKSATVVYQFDTNFKQSVFVDQYNGNNNFSQNQVTDGTIVFSIAPVATTVGFSFNLIPNYEDASSNSPNYWTGVSGDSLTRNQPINVKLLDDQTVVKDLILDDIVIPSTVNYSVVTGDPSVSGSTKPGSQVLDQVMQMYIQPRVRNSERDSDNAYYMGNVSFHAYLPYKKLANGKYLSATLDTANMNQWIADITTRNGGNEKLRYKQERQTDGRIILTYYFVDQTQEYLLRVMNLQMFYTYPSAVNENGDRFETGDKIFYTNQNLGRTFHNYFYDENGQRELRKREVVSLGDSSETMTISGDQLELAYLNGSPNLLYSTVSTKGTESTALLGYSLLTNRSTAQGNVKVNYQFDTENTWNYGVTTVQYWTVDTNYSDGTITRGRDYTYSFDFVLQKKGTNQTISGRYDLKPSEEYKNVKITKSNGRPANLLGYANERYYYYVNREMLAKGLSTTDKQAFDDSGEYYIKDLSYNMYISASGTSSYISGDTGRPRESGGQYYGYTFGEIGDQAIARFNIVDPADNTKELLTKRDYRTRIIKSSLSETTLDLTLLLDNQMTVKNEAGVKLTELTEPVGIGEKLSVSAIGIPCFYPYGATNYAPDPVFIIRTPVDFDLYTESIRVTQGGEVLDRTIEPLGTLSDGSKIYYVKPENGKGMGYYDESRELIGGLIQIDYDMEVNHAVRGGSIGYRELLFIADEQFQNGGSGSYASYRVNDTFGVNERLKSYGKTPSTKINSNLYGLMTCGGDPRFNTITAEVDKQLSNELIGTGTTEITDPLNIENGGVLDKKDATFDLSFTMSNTKQSGYVDHDGLFVFYMPVAKEGIQSDWNPERINEFSLELTGPVKITSSLGINYQVRYTIATENFDNRGTGFNGPAGYADYLTYDEIESNSQLDQVTMVKVVAELTAGQEHVIPFGEVMNARMPLKFAENNSQEFGQYTGQITNWRPYVIQSYTANGFKNDYRSAGSEKTVRIRYRPEEQVRDIWAYNENDYQGGVAPGGEILSKQTSVKLPDFNKNFNLELNKFNNDSLINMNLATVTDIVTTPNRPVSYGNTTFAFATDLNGTGNLTNPDIYQAYGTSGQNIQLGATTSSGNTLRYQIYNADNINDPSGNRQIRVTYHSIDGNGKPTDDVAFTVLLNIKRKVSAVEAETALIAGKVYREFPNLASNIKTTLTDGAFTTQFALEAQNFPTFSGKDASVFLVFGDENVGAGLPPDGSFLLKVQSSYEDNGEKKLVTPEYFYYKNKSGSTQQEISLTEFTKMGTDQKMTLADIDRQIEAVRKTGMVNGKLSYLIVSDFANGHAEEVSENTINLKYEIDDGSNAPQTAPKYSIEAKRKISSAITKPAINQVYEQSEAIEVDGRFELDSLGTVIDAYNLNKSLGLNVRLLKDGQAIDWPQGTLLDNNGEIITPRVINSDLQFIYPVAAIGNTNSIAYDFSIITEMLPLAVGDYSLEVTSLKSLSTTHPLNGDSISKMMISFTVKAKVPTGLRVHSDLKRRVIYNQTSNQKTQLTLAYENLTTIEAVLEKKNSLGNYEVIPNTADIITSPLTVAISDTNLDIKFNTIEASDNGEYRISFTGYRDSEKVVATAWTFIVWDQPTNN
ncbi:hypothetical protein [Enterococcus alishanensis]